MFSLRLVRRKPTIRFYSQNKSFINRTLESTSSIINNVKDDTTNAIITGVNKTLESTSSIINNVKDDTTNAIITGVNKTTGDITKLLRRTVIFLMVLTTIITSIWVADKVTDILLKIKKLRE